MRKILLVLCFFLGAFSIGYSQLIHYWNFNTSTSETTVLTVSSSLLGSPGIARETGGTSTIQFPGTGQGFDVDNFNARNGSPAGDHLRFNNPGTGGSLTFSLPTNGYKDLIVKYASRKSSTSAAQTQNISYSTDGTNFTNFTTIEPTETPVLYTIDFTSITSANDNPNFKVRISFIQGTGGTTGNHRFDNFSIDGVSLAPSDILPPTVTSVNFASTTSIVVEFNETVTNPSATNIANYTVSGGITVNSITYDNATKKATLTINPLTDGLGYSVTVNNIVDASANANTMTIPYVSPVSIFNASTPPLIITEIMYNALNVPEADALEFIEIYNNSANVVKAGGLKIKDANNFNFTLPETDIPANGFLLLATDKTGAEAFYTGKTFIDLPVVGNVLSNGGELIQLLNSSNTVVDEVNYDDVAPWPVNADERGYSLELYNLTLDNNVGQNWGVPSTFVKKLNNVDIFATPGSFTPTAAPLSFASDKTNTSETGGNLSIPINIAFSSSVDVSTQVTVAGGNAAAGTDYTFTNQNITFAANSTAQQNVNLQILDNTAASQDKYLVLQLGTVTNGSLGSIKQHIVFIKDNDRTPIAPSNALNLTFTGNYKVPETGSSAEISAFDPGTDRMFVVNSLLNKMEILNFSNPAAITRISTIDMAPFGAGLNSIAVKNGIVAVAVENATTTNGKVAFFDTNGAHLKSVDAGNLPDMVTFTPDGKFVLTANEAQPIFYMPTLSDPEGSVTLVDLSSVKVPADVANITQANVTQINFNAFDSQLATLKSQGVRIFGPGSTVSQDLEPEFITVSADSKKAWVTLQENNAIAIIDLVSKTVTEIKPLGFKDHSLPENSFDASDISSDVFFGTWKVRGLYMPDAIASYEVGGIPYVITANEGDAREYTGITDEVTFGSLNLDPTAFPDAAVLKNNSALGRLAVTNKDGDTDGDGDFDEVYSFGARSFTIWNGNTGARVFDSGNQLERITSEDPTWSSFFNASNGTGAPARKNRSDNKGPEPEGVTVAEINGRHYAFVGLERIGGVVTYDVTNPAAPIFVGYDNNRSNPVTATTDLGTEGIIYISAADSPTGTALVVLANEISATMSVYTLDGILNVDPTVATSATNISASGFTANWNAASGATGYQLDVSADNFITFVTGYNSKSVSGTSEVVASLSPGKTYQYRVRVVNGTNNSVSSNVISALTLKQSQTVTFTAPSDKTLGDASFALSATSTSGLTVAFSTTSDKISIAGSQVTLLKAGRASVTANQDGNASFLPASAVERNFCIKPSKPTATLNNANPEAPVLTSSSTTGNQWFLNGNAIDGANNATYNTASAGIYKVQVKVDDCVSEFSSDVSLIVTGDLPNASSSISLYPNPVEDYLQIEGISDIQELRLIDIAGKERKISLERNADGYHANVKDLPSGMYVLRLTGDAGVYQLKFVKK